MAAFLSSTMLEKTSFLPQIFIKHFWKAPILKFRNGGCRGVASSSGGQQPVEEAWSENDHVNPLIENRNPRNLEKMSLAIKPKGFQLDSPSTSYYYKLFLERNSKYTKAYVQHNSGDTVISASTQEWAIRKHLYSGVDVASAHNIGRIIARRCLESGILHVHEAFTQEEKASETVSVFLKAVEDGGLSLEEPWRIYPLRPWD